jgi:hypothetical protein
MRERRIEKRSAESSDGDDFSDFDGDEAEPPSIHGESENDDDDEVDLESHPIVEIVKSRKRKGCDRQYLCRRDGLLEGSNTMWATAIDLQVREYHRRVS